MVHKSYTQIYKYCLTYTNNFKWFYNPNGKTTIYLDCSTYTKHDIVYYFNSYSVTGRNCNNNFIYHYSCFLETLQFFYKKL